MSEQWTPEAEKATAEVLQRFKRLLEPFGLSVTRKVERGQGAFRPPNCEFHFALQSDGKIASFVRVLSGWLLERCTLDAAFLEHFAKAESRTVIAEAMSFAEQEKLSSARVREWNAAADWLVKRFGSGGHVAALALAAEATRQELK